MFVLFSYDRNYKRKSSSTARVWFHLINALLKKDQLYFVFCVFIRQNKTLMHTDYQRRQQHVSDSTA